MMVDMLEKKYPGVFSDPSIKFLDPYAKSGLYITEVTKRLYKGLKAHIPNSEERIKWILENQVYAVAPSKILYNIVRNYVYPDNLRSSAKNIAHLDLTQYMGSNQNWTQVLAKSFGGEALKFDVIIGNPPYQRQMEGTSDDPIYHLFMDHAYKLADKVCFITPARFLFNAGKTPKLWNEKMLKDCHLRVVFYEQNSSRIFPGMSFAGGVAITYRDAHHDFGPIGTFIPHAQLKSTLEKVLSLDFTTIVPLVYAPESYKFSETLHEDYPDVQNRLSRGHMYDVVTNIFEKLPEVFLDSKPDDGEDYIQILGLENRVRRYKWIRRNYLREHDNLERFKVILPTSNGSGAIGEVVPTMLIGEPVLGLPFVGHTQSFISIGCFETEYEATAALKYIKTKFARALLGILKVTQHNKQNTWRYVPLQDFTTDSDIDWSKSIAEIDQQLYEKYALTTDEVAFIETSIRAME
jgi:hypothetical protein